METKREGVKRVRLAAEFSWEGGERKGREEREGVKKGRGGKDVVE